MQNQTGQLKILVRLPNWLGDMIMSVGFLNQLEKTYPGAEISVIAKKGIHELLDFFPTIKHRFIFNKNEDKGMKGLRRFGKMIQSTDEFDLFFCLPNSFSSALMAKFTGAKKTIGYRNELRSIFLTHAYSKPIRLHRVDEYIRLLELFSGQKTSTPNVKLHHSFTQQDHVVVNINSEASSRRLTISKAKEILDHLRVSISNPIVLIGAPNEKLFVEEVLNGLKDKSGIENKAGSTTLPELAGVIASAQAMLTTDSGPAHLGNALGTHTIVLFGAGNENNTAPYIEELRTIIRLGQLSCEPCTKNVCTRFDTPQCLERLSAADIVDRLKANVFKGN